MLPALGQKVYKLCAKTETPRQRRYVSVHVIQQGRVLKKSPAAQIKMRGVFTICTTEIEVQCPAISLYPDRAKRES